MKSGLLMITGMVTLLGAGEYFYYNQNERISLTPVDRGVQTRDIKGPVTFLEKDRNEVVVANRVLLKLSDETKLDALLAKYGLKILKRYETGGLYLLEAPDAYAAIRAANALHDEPGVLFSQPDIGRKRIVR